jgi:rhamnosyltransferase
MTNIEKICSIIPTYRPDLDFPSRLELVARQVECVIVVDDSGCPEVSSKIDSFVSRYSNLVVLHNESNRGLAASLNRGMAEAKRLGYEWILTLDDDTVVMPDLCIQLYENWSIISKSIPLGILALSWRNSSGLGTGGRAAYRDKRMVITSGSFMSMDTYKTVGSFREEFIIDAVDADYCLRVRASGLRVIEASRHGFDQRLGNSRLVQFGPFRLALQEHTPLRTYYRVRNSTKLAMESWRREPAYAAGCLYWDLEQVFAVLLFYKQKVAHLAAMAVGLKHAWKGLLGFR